VGYIEISTLMSILESRSGIHKILKQPMQEGMAVTSVS